MKEVSLRWMNIKKECKKPYEEQAVKDKRRYESEQKIYKAKLASEQEEKKCVREIIFKPEPRKEIQENPEEEEEEGEE
jgi:hypothetical protein